jgi:hypothetical protein
VTADEILAISHQISDAGRLSIEPMLRLERDSAPGAVGESVLTCLDAFRDIDGTPDPDHVEKLLRFVGSRSWAPYARRAINISVEGTSDDLVTLYATRANGRGAYAYGDPVVACPRDADAIGEQVAALTDKLAR